MSPRQIRLAHASRSTKRIVVESKPPSLPTAQELVEDRAAAEAKIERAFREMARRIRVERFRLLMGRPPVCFPDKEDR